MLAYKRRTKREGDAQEKRRALRRTALKETAQMILSSEDDFKYYRGADRARLQALLRDNNFRSTEGRLNLLGILKREKAPLSVEEIVRRLKRNLDRVNAYRSLEALAKAGVIMRTHLHKGGAYYEMPDKHHHHVICNNCGVAEDIEGCEISSELSRLQKKMRTFSSINSHSLEFFGVCTSCDAS